MYFSNIFFILTIENNGRNVKIIYTRKSINGILINILLTLFHKPKYPYTQVKFFCFHFHYLTLIHTPSLSHLLPVSFK